MTMWCFTCQLLVGSNLKIGSQEKRRQTAQTMECHWFCYNHIFPLINTVLLPLKLIWQKPNVVKTEDRLVFANYRLQHARPQAVILKYKLNGSLRLTYCREREWQQQRSCVRTSKRGTWWLWPPPLWSVVVAPVSPPQPGQAKSQTQWLQTWASNPSSKPLCVRVS